MNPPRTLRAAERPIDRCVVWLRQVQHLRADKYGHARLNESTAHDLRERPPPARTPTCLCEAHRTRRTRASRLVTANLPSKGQQLCAENAAHSICPWPLLVVRGTRCRSLRDGDIPPKAARRTRT